MLHRLSGWRWPMLCLLLCACSGYAPPAALIGMNRNDLVAAMGQPDTERQLGTESRLEFPRGPFGKQTWFVYFDANGKASRAEQVLTETNFNRVTVDMAQDAVRQLLGRPSEVQVLGRARGVVWSYRYENQQCIWFQVELSAQQQVRSAGYDVRAECQGPDDRVR